jgi:hypothetical protein
MSHQRLALGWIRSFIFFAELGFELRAYTLSHSTSPFFCVLGIYFQDRFFQTICLGWL